MKFASLFSGIGGFDLAFERAGMVPVLQCEINRAAQSVLRRHWPTVEIVEDVRNVGNVAADVICGGFPCQDLSVAGRRAGLAGERSGLWFEFRRVLQEARPRWAVIENVPGLLSSEGGRDFAVILHGLGELGYYAAWRVLDAQYFGVAQRRRRVFVVASLGDGRCAQVLFEQESGGGDTSEGESARADVAATIRSRSAGAGVNRPGRGGEDDVNLVVGSLRSHSHGPDFVDAAAGHIIAPAHTAHFRARYDPTNEAYVIAFTERTRADGRNFESMEEIAHALTNPGSGGRTHSRQIAGAFGVRRLTPVECERLQGFPDGWTDGQSDSARYRQLGNAVCVPVAEWIGRRIMEVEVMK